MWKLLDFGYDLLNSASALSSWLLTPINGLSLPVTWNGLSFGTLDIPINFTPAGLLVGSGLVFVLGFRVVKFFVGIVTGS